MALEMKNTLAILSFIAIGLLVYPMVTGVQWNEISFGTSSHQVSVTNESPRDWRALISE